MQNLKHTLCYLFHHDSYRDVQRNWANSVTGAFMYQGALKILYSNKEKLFLTVNLDTQLLFTFTFTIQLTTFNGNLIPSSFGNISNDN